jgi:hypothetical protein
LAPGGKKTLPIRNGGDFLLGDFLEHLGTLLVHAVHSVCVPGGRQPTLQPPNESFGRGLAAWQNWKFVRLLNGFFQPTSFFELLLFGFLKTSPLLVIMLLLLRYHEELFGSYETEEWRHFPKGGVIAGKPGSGSASEHGPSQMDSRPDKL